MKRENDLMDSLLREHAEMKKDEHRDERFLRELEKRIDLEESQLKDKLTQKVVAKKEVIYLTNRYNKNASNKGWAMGLGAAACVAIGFMGYQSLQGNKDDLVLNNEKAAEQIANSPMAQEYAQKRVAPLEDREATVLRESEVADSLDLAGAPPTSEAESDAKSIPLLSDSNLSNNYNTAKSGSRKESPSKNNGIMPGALGKGAPLSDKKLKSARSSKDKGFESGKAREMRHRPPHPPMVNSERYGDLIENKWISPVDKDSKRSTFAVDVDTASYANLRRMLLSNAKVPANAVRIEEMVNYFDYNYAQPTGEHPFAVHVDSATCPWNEENKLVRIAIQGKDLQRGERPASNIVFLLDVSGSMNNADKLPLLKESLKYLLEELNQKDTVSIVVYAGASGLALAPTHVTDEGRRNIISALNNLSAGGSTAGGQGIKLAYKTAKENFVKKGVNRVILATDGDFNVGVSSTKGLTDMVKDEAKDGVYLSVLGFGTGNINDGMLEAITNNGNGNYSYIDTIKEGRKVLLEDMAGTLVTIAKDVKVRVEFNPEKVKEYRLIGYANRVLPNSAFLDKKADAGEIGAGHTVTAFYEVVPSKAADKSKLDDLRFGKKQETEEVDIPAEHADKLLFVDLAYKRPDQKTNDESTYLSVPLVDSNKAWADADVDFKFASSAALFGMVLTDSDFRGDGDLNLVEKMATEGKGNDGKGYREEFLKLVEKAKKREIRK